MSANRLHLAIGFGIVVLSVFECIQAYPHLPDPMASNFGGDGTPGGWSSKKSFMIIYAVSMAFWSGALLAAPFLAATAPVASRYRRLVLDCFARVFRGGHAFGARGESGNRTSE